MIYEIWYDNKDYKFIIERATAEEKAIYEAEAECTRLRSEISDLEYEKNECENRLAEAKRRLYHYQDKLQRLKSAQWTVNDDFNTYVNAVVQFESEAEDEAARKHLVIDECIDLVDEMEAVFR